MIEYKRVKKILTSWFGKKEVIYHFDYVSKGDVTQIDHELNKHIELNGNSLPEICCSRFECAVKGDLVTYSYGSIESIDETQWYIKGFYHLYFCPFCGEKIKGIGFGEYDEIKDEREVLIHSLLLD